MWCRLAIIPDLAGRINQCVGAGRTSFSSLLSHRQALSGVMWVPPIQRSIPRSSTRSASPRSVRSPVAVSRSWRRAKSWPSPSGGGGGSGVPSSVSRSLVVSLPERGERSVEPGVAEEGRLLESLRGNERGGRCAGAGGDRLERRSFRPREAVCRRGQLLEQPPQRGGEKRQLRGLPRRPLGQRRGLRRLEGGPGARRRLEARPVPPAARGPERLELARGQLAETGERRLAGEGADDDQLGRGLLGVREREHVEELELVVEVVLEPEHHLDGRRGAPRAAAGRAARTRRAAPAGGPSRSRRGSGRVCAAAPAVAAPAPAPRGARPARAGRHRRARFAGACCRRFRRW